MSTIFLLRHTSCTSSVVYNLPWPISVTQAIITTGHPIFMICHNIISHIILLSDTYIIIKQIIYYQTTKVIIKHLILFSTLQPIILTLDLVLSLSQCAALAHRGATGRAFA